MLAAIEESGAAQTEILAALGVVQSLLPTLGISLVNDAPEISQQRVLKAGSAFLAIASVALAIRFNA